MDPDRRRALAEQIARQAGSRALARFRRIDELSIESKGHQDFVSDADRAVEHGIRAALARACPDDAIVGEEHPASAGNSGFTWVIDPIDGTANFINAIPTWAVVLAGVSGARTRIGVIHDPCHDETFVAVAGGGAWLNGRPLALPATAAISRGSIGIGYSNRCSAAGVRDLVGGIIRAGGVFQRNASGALSLAHVAAGRLLGYAEEHMNAWDCLAGQLLVAEAGGRVEQQDADSMIAHGGRVIAATPGVFDDLVRICDAAWSPAPEPEPGPGPA